MGARPEAVRPRKRLRMSKAMRRRLAMCVRGQRRTTLYKMIAQRHGGQVPCFVCGRHVAENRASLEHIVRRRDGGTDDMSNLAISHEWCNTHRDEIEAGLIGGRE